MRFTRGGTTFSLEQAPPSYLYPWCGDDLTDASQPGLRNPRNFLRLPQLFLQMQDGRCSSGSILQYLISALGAISPMDSEWPAILS